MKKSILYVYLVTSVLLADSIVDISPISVTATGVSEKVTIQLAYAIGVVEPVSVFIDTHGTSKVDETKLEKCVREIFKLTPKGIIESLNLLEPIYSKTASYGHFGREEDSFHWEKIDKVKDIKSFFNI